MAQDNDLCISDAAHSNANADIPHGCFSKECDSELKVVLQAVVESHNKTLTNQMFARIDEFERKMHTCWTSLQNQMKHQQDKSSRQDERFERVESTLVSHSQSLEAVVKELSALRGDIQQILYVPHEADHPSIQEFPEPHIAWGEALGTFEAPKHSSTEVDTQSLPFPTKLTLNHGEIVPPALPQSLLAVPPPPEGSISEGSCLTHISGETFNIPSPRAMSNTGVEAILNQNLYCGSAIDDSTEWSLWSTEPKEQLAGNDASSCQVMSCDSHPSSSSVTGNSNPTSSSVQGATDTSLSLRFAGDEGSERQLRIGVDDVRTVMIKNIPCRYSNQDMLDVFAELGFGNEPIFFHLPSRYKQDSNLGYAFVGFNNKDVTARFAEAMTGYKFKHSSSRKRCVVTPAHIQGMRKNVNHFSQGRKYNPPRLSM